MAAGNDLTGPGLKSEAGSYASEFIRFIMSFLGWDERLEDHGGPQGQTIRDAYEGVYGNNPDAAMKAESDAFDLKEMVAAIRLVINYALARKLGGARLPKESGQAVIDNTTGSAAATALVPVGAKCYIVTDPDMIAQHDGVGVDKGPAIRKLAGTRNY